MHGLCAANILGPGPFEAVQVVDESEQGLAAGLILRTQIGEREINEVWLTLAPEQECPDVKHGTEGAK